jgi:hypothetical protein
MKIGMTRMNKCPQFYFFCRTSFKVGTGPNQRQNHDPTHVWILTNQLSKLKKLEENWLIAQHLVAFNSGTGCYGFKIGTLKPNINLEIMLYGFQRLSMHIPLSFKGDGLDPIRFNNVYLTILY